MAGTELPRDRQPLRHPTRPRTAVTRRERRCGFVGFRFTPSFSTGNLHENGTYRLLDLRCRGRHYRNRLRGEDGAPPPKPGAPAPEPPADAKKLFEKPKTAPTGKPGPVR
jgi:hypothetical protein